MFENRTRYLAGSEHYGVICNIARGDLDGDQELLRKEIDLMRGHRAISLDRFRATEREMEVVAFALWPKRKARYRKQNEIRLKA
jgi:hypothetical protein